MNVLTSNQCSCRCNYIEKTVITINQRHNKNLLTMVDYILVTFFIAQVIFCKKVYVLNKMFDHLIKLLKIAFHYDFQCRFYLPSDWQNIGEKKRNSILRKKINNNCFVSQKQSHLIFNYLILFIKLFN